MNSRDQKNSKFEENKSFVFLFLVNPDDCIETKKYEEIIIPIKIFKFFMKNHTLLTDYFQIRKSSTHPLISKKFQIGSLESLTIADVNFSAFHVTARFISNSSFASEWSYPLSVDTVTSGIFFQKENEKYLLQNAF